MELVSEGTAGCANGVRREGSVPKPSCNLGMLWEIKSVQYSRAAQKAAKSIEQQRKGSNSHLLKVISAHGPVSPIPVQAFNALLRKLLTRIKVLALRLPTQYV